MFALSRACAVSSRPILGFFSQEKSKQSEEKSKKQKNIGKYTAGKMEILEKYGINVSKSVAEIGKTMKIEIEEQYAK